MDGYTPIQADYASDPWKVLVCCALLNLTSRTQVRPIMQRLFKRWPTPRVMAEADLMELGNFLKPTGMGFQKAHRVRRMSEEYADCETLSCPIIDRLHGCGKYAADAFRIFCQGDLAFAPGDPVLQEYITTLR